MTEYVAGIPFQVIHLQKPTSSQNYPRSAEMLLLLFMGNQSQGNLLIKRQAISVSNCKKEKKREQ
jgi:hypothetical protein